MGNTASQFFRMARWFRAEHGLSLLSVIVASIVLGLALSCGGGGNSATSTVNGTNAANVGTNGTSGTTAPSNLFYPEVITAMVGQAITADIPTVTGTVSSYTVNPALPAGLNLNSSNGVISGSPTAVTPTATYTVTAANSSGSTTASVTITVNKALSSLLKLGHDTPIQRLRFVNSRVLSQGYHGHWVLSDYDSGAILANGDQGWPPAVPCCYGGGQFVGQTVWPVDMAGATLVIGIENGLEVRSSSDGHLLATIVFPGLNSYGGVPPTAAGTTWWQLASDGSYVCAGSKLGLLVWAPTGEILVSRTGDYSVAQSFAAPGEVRVALGPAGQNVVETVSTADGTSYVSDSFSGQFHAWFLDGERFLTSLSNVVWIYSKAGVQQNVISLPTADEANSVIGQANWLWTYTTGPSLNVYSLGSSTPVVTYSTFFSATIIPSATTIAAFITSESSTAISVIDLSGASPSKVDYTLPIGGPTAYAATSSSQWIVGNFRGAVLDGASLSGAPRYLALGAAWSIAGATGRAAVSTASGTNFYFDPSVTTQEGTISFSSRKLALSSDGTVLAASSANGDIYNFDIDRTLNIYSLPSGALTNSFPYTANTSPWLFDFSLSASGTLLGQVLATETSLGTSYTRQVTATTGGATIWSDQGQDRNNPILLSPDGTLIAVSNGTPSFLSATIIYKNGTLLTAVPGFAIGWIDNNRILVNSYTSPANSSPPYTYSGCAIYDTTGAKIATPALPELHTIQTVTSDSVYSPELNSIFSLTTGQATWISPYNNKVGAVSGPYVVFEAASQVFVDSY
jgi:hypothetical protein